MHNPNPHRSRKWLIVMVLLALVCGGVALKSRFHRPPSVTLPDGTRIEYLSGTRGTPMTGSPRMFRHPPPAVPRQLPREAWQWLRNKLPARLQARLPAWPTPPSTFPGGIASELELRLRFTGSLQRHQWDIYVADDNGWETVVPDYVAADPSPVPGLSTAKPEPGWIRLDSPYPRHSKKVYLRFRPNPNVKPGLTDAERRAVAGELVLENPFYEGPPSAPGPRPPMTKPFRYGEFRLEKLTRDRLVSGAFMGLRMNLSLWHDQEPLAGFVIRDLGVTDRSGQYFRPTSGGSSGGQGRHSLTTSTAPWSDDLCWTLRFEVARGDYCSHVTEQEKFVFDHLPVPHDSGVEVNRTITTNGISLRISRIELSEYGDWRFCVEGWRLDTSTPRRLVLIQDAHDDQGRTHAEQPRGGKFRLVGGPVGGTSLGPVYAVHLPPDAKWWDLTLVPETAEVLEFQVQPELKP